MEMWNHLFEEWRGAQRTRVRLFCKYKDWLEPHHQGPG